MFVFALHHGFAIVRLLRMERRPFRGGLSLLPAPLGKYSLPRLLGKLPERLTLRLQPGLAFFEKALLLCYLLAKRPNRNLGDMLSLGMISKQPVQARLLLLKAYLLRQVAFEVPLVFTSLKLAGPAVQRCDERVSLLPGCHCKFAGQEVVGVKPGVFAGSRERVLADAFGALAVNG